MLVVLLMLLKTTLVKLFLRCATIRPKKATETITLVRETVPAPVVSTVDMAYETAVGTVTKTTEIFNDTTKRAYDLKDAAVDRVSQTVVYTKETAVDKVNQTVAYTKDTTQSLATTAVTVAQTYLPEPVYVRLESTTKQGYETAVAITESGLNVAKKATDATSQTYNTLLGYVCWGWEKANEGAKEGLRIGNEAKDNAVKNVWIVGEKVLETANNVVGVIPVKSQ